MFDFFHKNELWWGLAGIFVVLFAIAAFPKPSIESFGWLLFAAICAAIAMAPDGFMAKGAHAASVYLWQDLTMRWHLAGATAFLVLAFLSMGMTGFVPLLFTALCTHPLSFLTFAKELNRNQLGDDAWPFLLLSGIAAPWAFPSAYAITSWTSVSSLSSFLKMGIYVGIVAAWWLIQSFGFSFLMFKKSVF